MNELIIMVIGLFLLSIISGMLGLGVAFAAIPFLGLFLPDLVNQVQPLSLLLNGVTALFAVFGFAKSGYVDWKKAIYLTIVATLAAPIGAWLVHYVPQIYVWFLYFGAVFFLAYRLFKPVKHTEGQEENFKLALILAIPISVLAGFLGVGPGFILMPTLILVGFEPKKAAGITAFAVIAPSFSSLIPHLATAQWDLTLMIPLLIAGAIGSFAGARITSLYMPSSRMKQMFAIMILVVTFYKIFTLVV